MYAISEGAFALGVSHWTIHSTVQKHEFIQEQNNCLYEWLAESFTQTIHSNENTDSFRYAATVNIVDET